MMPSSPSSGINTASFIRPNIWVSTENRCRGRHRAGASPAIHRSARADPPGSDADAVVSVTITISVGTPPGGSAHAGQLANVGGGSSTPKGRLRRRNREDSRAASDRRCRRTTHFRAGVATMSVGIARSARSCSPGTDLSTSMTVAAVTSTMASSPRARLRHERDRRAARSCSRADQALLPGTQASVELLPRIRRRRVADAEEGGSPRSFERPHEDGGRVLRAAPAQRGPIPSTPPARRATFFTWFPRRHRNADGGHDGPESRSMRLVEVDEPDVRIGEVRYDRRRGFTGSHDESVQDPAGANQPSTRRSAGS